MGLSPAQVGDSGLWEFMAAVEGYGRAQGWTTDNEGEPMSAARLAELGIEGFA